MRTQANVSRAGSRGLSSLRGRMPSSRVVELHRSAVPQSLRPLACNVGMRAALPLSRMPLPTWVRAGQQGYVSAVLPLLSLSSLSESSFLFATTSTRTFSHISEKGPMSLFGCTKAADWCAFRMLSRTLRQLEDVVCCGMMSKKSPLLPSIPTNYAEIRPDVHVCDVY